MGKTGQGVACSTGARCAKEIVLSAVRSAAELNPETAGGGPRAARALTQTEPSGRDHLTAINSLG